MKDPDVVKHEIARRIEQKVRRTLLELSKDLLNIMTSSIEGINIEEILKDRLRNIDQALQEARSSIEYEVMNLVDNIEEALSLFDGKLLLNKLASKLNLKADELKLLIASIQRDMNNIPKEIQEFISNLRYVASMEPR